MTDDPRAWGRWATFGLGLLALLGSQAVALSGLTWWYGVGIAHLPDFSGDGVAVTLSFLPRPRSSSRCCICLRKGAAAMLRTISA